MKASTGVYYKLTRHSRKKSKIQDRIAWLLNYLGDTLTKQLYQTSDVFKFSRDYG